MSEAHLDNPGEIRWWKGHGPVPIVGPCPHTACSHDMQNVIAWGPDFRRYELIVCDVKDGCAGRCRAWADERCSGHTTTAWLHVAA